MAKKKAVKTEEKDELDDFDDDLLEDDEIESVFPKLKEDKDKISKATSLEEPTEEEELEFEQEEEEERFPDYKYLNLEIKKVGSENDYEVFVDGQSHGFCNILVKYLLEIEGVNIAAYKDTKLEPATIFIRLEKNYEIKDVLHQGIESLRKEVIKVQKIFNKLI